MNCRAQPAFSIGIQDWKLPTRKVELLTPDLGLITVFVNTDTSPCTEFQLLDADISENNGQLRLTSLIRKGPLIRLKGEQIYCGMYLNELLLRLLPRQDSNPSLFGLYQSTLQHVSLGDQAIQALRYFERRFLDVIGYGINFDRDDGQKPIIEQNWYEFIAGKGFRCSEGSDSSVVRGDQIKAIARNNFQYSAETLGYARIIFQAQIDFLLAGKELKSRQLVRDTHKKSRSGDRK